MFTRITPKVIKNVCLCSWGTLGAYRGYQQSQNQVYSPSLSSVLVKDRHPFISAVQEDPEQQQQQQQPLFVVVSQKQDNVGKIINMALFASIYGHPYLWPASVVIEINKFNMF